METWLRGERVLRGGSQAMGGQGARTESWCGDERARPAGDCRMPGMIATMSGGAGADDAAISDRRRCTMFMALLRSRMEALGMKVRSGCGGESARALADRSDGRTNDCCLARILTRCRDAGAFDGVLGVVLALEWVGIAQEMRLPLAIEVIAFSEEEGVRFGVPFLGSRAVAGTFRRCDAEADRCGWRDDGCGDARHSAWTRQRSRTRL